MKQFNRKWLKIPINFDAPQESFVLAVFNVLWLLYVYFKINNLNYIVLF